MWQADLVPELEQGHLVRGEKSIVLVVKFKVSCNGKRKMVDHVAFEGVQIPFENGNPQHKRNERPPYFLRSAPTKIITTVDTKSAVNVNNLLELPEEVHWHLTVGSSHI